MLKEKALKKILITSIFIVIILILYIFPNHNKENITTSFKSEVVYNNSKKGYIYILGNNDFLVQFETLLIDYDKLEDRIRNIIEKLINNSSLPNGFNTIVPNNTKINSIAIENDYLKIDFSKDILDIPEKKYEKLIQSICYSIFEIDSINSITISIEKENINKYIKDIPNKITRDYGINIVTDINNLNGINKIITYYIDRENGNSYYVPVTSYVNTNKDKIKVIIENLSSNYIYEPNLISLLDSKTELINYEINDDVMKLYFNNSIFLSDGYILEEVIYSISYSVFDNYNVNKVMFYVDDKEITYCEKNNCL